MGFEAEEQLPKGDFYCEQCRPDLHVELLKYAAIDLYYDLANRCVYSRSTIENLPSVPATHPPATSSLPFQIVLPDPIPPLFNLNPRSDEIL